MIKEVRRNILTRKSSYGKLQEAYHFWNNLSKHNLSGGYPILAGGYHILTCRGYPILIWLGYPQWDWGTSCLGLGYPRKDMGPVEVLWNGDGEPPTPPPPPPPGCELTNKLCTRVVIIYLICFLSGNDGNLNTNNVVCTHTNDEYRPWWLVDLSDTVMVTHVIVTNRGDGSCEYILSPLQCTFNNNYIDCITLRLGSFSLVHLYIADRLKNIAIGVGDEFDSTDTASFGPSSFTRCLNHSGKHLSQKCLFGARKSCQCCELHPRRTGDGFLLSSLSGCIQL